MGADQSLASALRAAHAVLCRGVRAPHCCCAARARARARGAKEARAAANLNEIFK